MIDDADIEQAIGATHEAVGADAAAAELARGARRRGSRRGQACLNCGATLAEAYCHRCGQFADDFHRPFWALFAEALEDIFSFEGRFLRTVPRLLLRPGHVSAKYLEGARARFVAPFRLFLFASIAFFLAFSIRSGDAATWFDDDAVELTEEQLTESTAGLERAIEELGAEGDAPPGLVVGLEEARAALERTRADLERSEAELAELPQAERARASRVASRCAVRAGLVPEEPISPECVAAGRIANQTFDMSFDGADSLSLEHRQWIAERLGAAIERPQDWIASMQRWAPRVVFALFPLYAVLLAMLHFWRRGIYFYHHVVVSLHFHAFLFLFTVLLLLAELVLPFAVVVGAFLIWSNYGLYRTHRLVYADSRFGSAIRVILLDFIYLIVLSIAFVALMAIGIVFA